MWLEEREELFGMQPFFRKGWEQKWASHAAVQGSEGTEMHWWNTNSMKKAAQEDKLLWMMKSLPRMAQLSAPEALNFCCNFPDCPSQYHMAFTLNIKS